MGKNFSSITPETVSGKNTGPAADVSAGSPAAPAGGGSRRKKLVWAIAAAAAVLLVVLIVGVATRGGSGSSTSAGPAAPHGPAKIVDGAPTGYTHDKAGAATAAVNFMQASGLAWDGKLNIATVQQHMVAQNPTPALVSALSDAKDRQATGDTFNALPASTTVLSYTPDAADVSVWTVNAGAGAIDGNGNKAAIASWGTTSLHLVWEDGDWKVQDQSFHTGPQPGQPLPQGSAPVESGYYSFFVN